MPTNVDSHKQPLKVSMGHVRVKFAVVRLAVALRIVVSAHEESRNRKLIFELQHVVHTTKCTIPLIWSPDVFETPTCENQNLFCRIHTYVWIVPNWTLVGYHLLPAPTREFNIWCCTTCSTPPGRSQSLFATLTVCTYVWIVPIWTLDGYHLLPAPTTVCAYVWIVDFGGVPPATRSNQRIQRLMQRVGSQKRSTEATQESSRSSNFIRHECQDRNWEEHGSFPKFLGAIVTLQDGCEHHLKNFLDSI